MWLNDRPNTGVSNRRQAMQVEGCVDHVHADCLRMSCRSIRWLSNWRVSIDVVIDYTQDIFLERHLWKSRWGAFMESSIETDEACEWCNLPWAVRPGTGMWWVRSIHISKRTSKIKASDFCSFRMYSTVQGISKARRPCPGYPLLYLVSNSRVDFVKDAS